MAVNDLFTVKVDYMAQAKVMSSTFAYRATFAEAVVPLSRSLDDAFDADIIPKLLAVWYAGVELQSIYVLGINPAGRIPAVRSYNDKSGLILFEGYPNDSAYVIKQITDAPNSKHNGRIYMSGISDDSVTAQVLNLAFTTGVLADLATALAAVIVDPAAPTRIWQPVVVNRVANGVPVVPPGFFDVTAVLTQNTIFRQRRRRTKKTEIGALP